MIANVRSALGRIVGHVTVLEEARGAGRVFELFVMTKLALGLRSAGFSVWLQRSDGTIVQPLDADRRFIQRGGAPTGVSAAAAGPGNASVIGFRRDDGPSWEIWNGILFVGRSTATHEIDISIVPGSVGNAIRATGGTPAGRPRVAIECKDVGAVGGLDEMRAFVARLYDVTLLQAHHNYMHFPQARALHPGSPQGPRHQAVVTYWQENRRTKNIVARRTEFASGTAPLAQYYQIEPHRDIRVGSHTINDLVSSVVAWANRNV